MLFESCWKRIRWYSPSARSAEGGVVGKTTAVDLFQQCSRAFSAVGSATLPKTFPILGTQLITPTYSVI